MALFTLFGKKDTLPKEDKTQLTSFTPLEGDGINFTSAGGMYSNYMNMQNLSTAGFDENVLINKYREMSLSQELELAIDDIINEMISFDDDEDPISLLIKTDDISEKVREKIVQEFNEILKVLNFKYDGYDILKRWYVDGKLYYDKIIDKSKPKQGIQELRYIDPRKIRKVTENNMETVNGVNIYKAPTEYFIYSETPIGSTDKARQTNNTGVPNASTQHNTLRIEKDRICFVHSGLKDSSSEITLSYLHKAMRPFNILKMMEDSTVINKFIRAPQRKIFYVDVANLPKGKAEQYMKETMLKHRNKLSYNSDTGEFNSNHQYRALTEDYWMARRGGQSGTEIETLPRR